MKITLYTTHCPRCKIIEKKLNDFDIEYQEVTDTDEMLKMGMTTVPMLKVEDNLMNFHDALVWINRQRG